MKIDNKPVTQRRSTTGEYGEFVLTLGKLKPGQSFLFNLTSDHRRAIAVAEILLGIEIATAKEEGNTYRVGRLA